MVYNVLHACLVGRVEIARVQLDIGIPRGQVFPYRLEVGAVVVAQVHGLGSVLDELLGRGAPDAHEGVCSWRSSG